MTIYPTLRSGYYRQLSTRIDSYKFPFSFVMYILLIGVIYVATPWAHQQAVCLSVANKFKIFNCII